MRAALVQLTVSDDPEANLPETLAALRAAAAGGARFVLTPEGTNLLSTDRAVQRARLRPEAQDLTLAALRAEAARLGITLLVGSLGIADPQGDGRFANRSVLIGPDGAIRARYDKIHMFDVTVSDTEAYRESAAYRPGTQAVVAQAEGAQVGLAVCYDLRFPYLFRALAQGGAQILCLPAAFNDTTGAAHWEVLLRARAIETGCFVLAPAQCGLHPEAGGARRRTFGHSLAVSPWGEVIADGGTAPGVTFVDLDLAEVDRARARIPALAHTRGFEGP